MRVRNHGKYTKMSKLSPKSISRCDYSGMMVQTSLMVDQYQYAGQGLIKTGYRVNPKFADKPNPQNLTPLIKVDPRPILNARPDDQIDTVDPQLLITDVTGSSVITLSLDEFSNINFIFKGVLSSDCTIYVPATWNDFFVNNITTGGFTLYMQLVNMTNTLITLTPNVNLLVSTDGQTLKIIHPN